jgi:hypothetical protein
MFGFMRRWASSFPYLLSRNQTYISQQDQC